MMLPSNRSVMRQMSLKGAPLLQLYTTSIRVALKLSTYSSETSSSLHSALTSAMCWAVAWGERFVCVGGV